MASLELDLDLSEGLVDPESLLDQGVVDPDREDDQQDDDGDDDDGREIHAPPPIGRAIEAAIALSLAAPYGTYVNRRVRDRGSLQAAVRPIPTFAIAHR